MYQLSMQAKRSLGVDMLKNTDECWPFFRLKGPVNSVNP